MTHSWTSSGKFSRLLSHTELRSVFPRKRTSGSGTFSKCSSRILTSASSAMSGFCGLPVPSFFMASGTRHILDGYKPSRTRPLNLGEVHAHLLGFTPGGVCGLRLLDSLSSDGVLGLLGSLLSLLGYSSCGVLSLACHLSGLVCGLSDSLLRLSRCLSGRILHALRDLPNLIGNSAQRTSTFLSASEPADGVLH